MELVTQNFVNYLPIGKLLFYLLTKTLAFALLFCLFYSKAVREKNKSLVAGWRFCGPFFFGAFSF